MSIWKEMKRSFWQGYHGQKKHDKTENHDEAERLFEKYRIKRLNILKRNHGIEVIEQLAQNRGISTDKEPRELIQAIQEYERAASEADNSVGLPNTDLQDNPTGAIYEDKSGTIDTDDSIDELSVPETEQDSWKAHKNAQRRQPPVQIGDVRKMGVEDISDHYSGESVAVGHVEGFVIFVYDIPKDIRPLDIIRVKITAFNRDMNSARSNFIEEL